MNRNDRISRIRKIASKAGESAARGMNWFLNETAYNEVDITAILGITLDSRLQNITSAKEKKFLELGSFLTGTNNLTKITKYILLKKRKGKFSLEETYNWNEGATKEEEVKSGGFASKEGIITAFENLINDADSVSEGEYKSDIVVYRFKKEDGKEDEKKDGKKDGKEDGKEDKEWKVVYLPATGEMEPYPGIPESSYDRTLEGNKNGLCLGSTQSLYQNNDDGKIYSLRQRDNPKVTFRIQGDILHEAKGKFNNPPDIESAKRAKIWLETLKLDQVYKVQKDYKDFPPTTVEEAKKKWNDDKEQFLKSPWIYHWYKKGLEEFDMEIKNLDPMKIISMGLVEKYPKDFTDVIKGLVSRTSNLLSLDFGVRTPIWKIYKDAEWMNSAIKSTIENYPEESFNKELYNIKNYQDLFLAPSKANPELTIFENEFQKNISQGKNLDELTRVAVNPKFKDSIKKILEGQSLSTILKYKDLAELVGLKDLLKKSLEAAAEEDSHSFFSSIELSDRLGLDDLVASKLRELSKTNPSKFIYFIKNTSSTLDFLSKFGLLEAAREALKNIYKTSNFMEYLNIAIVLGLGDLSSKTLERFAFLNPTIYLESGEYMALAEKLGLKDLTKDTLMFLAENRPREYFNLDFIIEDPRFLKAKEVALRSIAHNNPDAYLSEDNNKYPNISKQLGFNDINKAALEYIVKNYPEDYFVREFYDLASELGLNEVTTEAIRHFEREDPDFLVDYRSDLKSLGLNLGQPIETPIETKSSLDNHLIKLSKALESLGMRNESFRVRYLSSLI